MKKEEKVITDVIGRFGHTIDLKKTPHVIIEIIRQFGPVLGTVKGMDCQPPGGPPKAGSEVIQIEDVMIEIRALSNQMERLHSKVDKLKTT